jgi:hypothetical protein
VGVGSCWRHQSRLIERAALGLPGFRVSKLVSFWLTVAGAWASILFDLERLISRQKVIRAAVLVMRSTLATSFQSNPLRSSPNMV